MGNRLLSEQLGLSLKISNTPLPSTHSYRPPSWPPPKDWVCIEDDDGNPVSRWGDSSWNLWPWAGRSAVINFGDGPKLTKKSKTIDHANANLFRLAITWRIWGFRGVKTVNTILNIHKKLKVVFLICSQNNIIATELSRYPRIIEQLAQSIAPSEYSQTIAELDTLLGVSNLIGFTILDASSIARLKASQPDYHHKQTEYIPPRIWQYQVKRLKQFIDDYRLHQHKIEECFAFCSDAYARNSVTERRIKGEKAHLYRPFDGKRGINNASVFHGPFLETAKKFGIDLLISKWIGSFGGGAKGIRLFSAYLSMAKYIGFAYVLNFTLARASEAQSIRFDCLKRHEDGICGSILLIQGATTKTIKDETALWVASPSIEDAVLVMQSVAKMRSNFLPSNQGNNFLLMHSGIEPWGSGKMPLVKGGAPAVCPYSKLISKYPLLFEKDELLITEDDFKIAISINPTLNKKIYQIGMPWPLAWHQLRRTGAVNMFSSGEISDSSIQIQLKHLSRSMSLSYGRGHTSLNLTDDVRTIIVNAQYEAMGKKLVELNSDRFISPFGGTHKAKMLSDFPSKNPINLISEIDAIHYESAARKHQINFRRTAIGGCMKNGRCDGDGVLALSDCAGGGGKAPCANALFDRSRAEANKMRLLAVIKKIESTEPGTARFRYLEQERRGLENYFACIE